MNTKKKMEKNDVVRIESIISGGLSNSIESKEKIKIMLLNTADLISNQKYQRDISQKKIAYIVSDYDPHRFGIPKVSFRDGKYYVYDGQHRIIAIRTKNGGDCYIQCEVHYGLTYKDEARLFRQQKGGETQVDIIYNWRAAFEEESEPISTIVNSVRAIGIEIPFTKAKANNRIVALSELNKMWMKLKPEETLRVLNLIKEAWGGEMNSFNKNILDGMKEFFFVYGDEVDDKRFIRQMSKTSPLKIERDGKLDRVSQGGLKFAKVIWNEYNHGLCKYRLDYKFKG